MNPTVKAVLLNERATVLSAIAAREGTISDLLVQLAAVENDVWRLRHRLVDLEAYLIGHRVELPDDAPVIVSDPDLTVAASVHEALPAPDGPAVDADRGVAGLPACRPLGDFVRQRAGKRKGSVAARQSEDA
jgi:hypothetical protein